MLETNIEKIQLTGSSHLYISKGESDLQTTIAILSELHKIPALQKIFIINPYCDKSENIKLGYAVCGPVDFLILTGNKDFQEILQATEESDDPPPFRSWPQSDPQWIFEAIRDSLDDQTIVLISSNVDESIKNKLRVDLPKVMLEDVS